MLLDRGMANTLPDFAPGAPTWRWRTSLGTLRTTLDHVLYDDRLEPLSAQTLQAGRSDHLPVVAVFVRSATSEAR